MKKPIAILKDSLREAWDSKALLVMLVLTGLFLVLVASVGYPEASARAVFDEQAKKMGAPVIRTNHGKQTIPLVFGEDGGPPRPLATYSITSFKVVKETTHAANGEYEMTVLVEPAPAKTGDADGFHTAVAIWHEDGSGKYLKIEGGNQLDPSKIKVSLSAITPEMIRTFFEEDFDRGTRMPITNFEELPYKEPENDKPKDEPKAKDGAKEKDKPQTTKRLFKITTGPSADPKTWPVRFSVLFGLYDDDDPAPAGTIVYLIQNIVINNIGGLMIIGIAIIITSFFIPNMLHPGAVVMLLSKPINRVTLLLFKYFGGLFFVLILATAVVGGVWLITGLRAGIWAPGVFVVIPLLTLSFAILYAVATLTAVFTRNSIVCILAAVFCGGVLWLAGKVESFAKLHRIQRDVVAKFRNEEPKYGTWAQVSGVINMTLPRWHDIDTLTGDTVRDSLLTKKQSEASGEELGKHKPSWGGTIAVTLVWIFGALGISCWRFAVKDY